MKGMEVATFVGTDVRDSIAGQGYLRSRIGLAIHCPPWSMNLCQYYCILMPNLTFRCSGRDSVFCTVLLRFQWVGLTLTFLAGTTAVQKIVSFLRM
jgi:hypothetical protein